MIRWVVDHATTVFLTVGAVFFFGLLSYVTLPREASPDITIPVVMISTPYVGVSPADIEGLVTIPFESELASLKNVKTMSSTSSEGISFVVIEFEPDTNVTDALQRVRDRVNRARPRLPNDVEESAIREISFSDMPVLLINISGNADEEKLKLLGERLQDDLTRIPGVLEARVSGGQHRQIRVQVLPERLAYYGLSLNDVTGAISNENVNVPGGDVKSGASNYLLRVPGEFTEPVQIEEVAIKRVGDRPVFVRDVARVVDGFEDRQTYSRLGGQPSITVSVTKRAGANILEVADLVKDELDDHAATWPEGVDYRVLGDQSRNVHVMVSDLQNNIITALLLVVAVVIFFMGFRNSLFVAFAIPMSMLSSFMVLDALGFTLNMVVLFSLMLALGMLVDNAIVVVENIYRHLEEGKDHRTAAIEGTNEVALAVAASTATTVAAFFPLVFWGGIMGEFMGFLPKTLIIVLVSSLLVAVFVLPLFASRFMRADRRDPDEGDLPTGLLMRPYKALLEWSIRWRYLSLGAMVAILFATFAIYGVLNHGTEFFPESDPDRATIAIRTPEGTDLEHTDRITRAIEGILATESNVDVWVAEPGIQGGDQFTAQAAPNEARITVDFHPHYAMAQPGERPRVESTNLTVERIRERVQQIIGAEIKVEKQAGGPPVGDPIAIEVTGEDFHVVGQAAQDLRRRINREVPGVTDLRDDYRVGRPEMRLRIDRGAAKRVGVSTNAVGGAVRAAVAGQKASALRKGEDEYDIIVELAPEYRDDLQSVLDLRLPGREDTSPDTFSVPLSAVASYELAGGSGAIKHKDQDLMVTIQGDIKDGFNENDVRAGILAYIDANPLPEGVHASIGGANVEQQESMAFLSRAFMLACALIMTILVTQFDSVSVPLIILGTVVLSLIGVLWGLLLTGTPFGVIMTGIGVISLAGVVVNNAIVLLDYVQQLEARGMSVHDALIRAGMTRFRPVMLTAITTTLGLVPMAIGASFDFTRLQIVVGSASNQMWGPMAVAVIFGLSFATVLTLVMVPTLYSISHDIRRMGDRAWGLVAGRTVGPAAKVLVGFLLLGAANEAAAVSLDEAFAAADEVHADLLIAHEQTVQAKTQTARAWATVQPQISTSGTYVLNEQELVFDMTDSFELPPELAGAFDFGSTEPTVIQEKDFFMADITVAQRFFSGTALPALKGAQQMAKAAALQERSTRQRIHAGVARAFYGLHMAREAVGVSEAALKSAESQLELAQRQKEAELTDSRAVLQAQLRLAQAKRDLEGARQQLVTAQEAFFRATGLARDSALELPGDPKVPASLKDALDQAKVSRPDVQASGHQLQAMKAQNTAGITAWAPTLDGQFQYAYSGNRGFSGGKPWQWQLSMVARWSLWDGGIRLANKRDYASQRRVAELRRRQLTEAAEEEVRVSWEGYGRAGRALESVETELELARENLRLARLAFEGGDASWLEVEQAELGVRSSELARIRERMNRDLAAIDLLVATGDFH